MHYFIYFLGGIETQTFRATALAIKSQEAPAGVCLMMNNFFVDFIKTYLMVEDTLYKNSFIARHHNFLPPQVPIMQTRTSPSLESLHR